MAIPRKLALPAALVNELGGTQSSSSRIGQRGAHRNSSSHASRTEQRKAVRIGKKHARSAQLRRSVKPRSQPQQHIRAVRKKSLEPQDRDIDEDNDNNEDDDLVDEHDSDEEMDEDDDGDSDTVERRPHQHLSQSGHGKFDQDDKEIAALEKKLGLRGNRRLPQSFGEDGLDDLLVGLDGERSDAPEALSKRKRKTEADEWLAQKRRKAQMSSATPAVADYGMNSSEEDDNLSADSSLADDLLESSVDNDEEGAMDDDGDQDGFGGFSDDDDESDKPPPRQRENPYVAPTTNVAKYVPPSLRKQSSDNNESQAWLQKRVQGLINRLTTENMIGIVKEFMSLYSNNPRQAVTSTLTDLLLALVCSPERRPDSFFGMTAGFVAAVHRAMGMAVSAHFIQQLVEMLQQHHEAASGDKSDAASKHLVSLLSELYNMQVISCTLIFDYVRVFLEDLNELNTELLLKIIQLSGPSLLRDDRHALSGIINRIKPSDSKNMSVRTRFMIDEMKKLQSNKTKAAARNKDQSEQRIQLRKKIGTLGGTNDVQPFRVGLRDIQDADKQGKWWLVGASWSGKGGAAAQDHDTKQRIEILPEETVEHEDEDLLIPDLWQLAREQGFNTEVRQQIFVALHAATDYEKADLLIRKLRLNKHQRKEIPEVVIMSAERQTQYNHYYTLVATRLTGDKEMKFQFRRSLTTRFRKMGEEIDTGGGDSDEDDDAEEASEYNIKWIYNVAKMFGFLVARQDIRLVDVIKYRNLAALQEKAHLLMEVMLMTMLRECKGLAGLKEVLQGLDADTAHGVQYFIKKYVRKTDLLDLDKKDMEKLKKRCDAAIDMLHETR
ncbi:hypothetical protein F5Y15DRAFT_403825 [Xylariaceae sp. FL0016]|nr:hypothetical protein F5Y15DRAFT_403825 [Xylariaceae sp. FL0016]